MSPVALLTSRTRICRRSICRSKGWRGKGATFYAFTLSTGNHAYLTLDALDVEFTTATNFRQLRRELKGLPSSEAIAEEQQEDEAEDSAKALDQWLKKMKCTGVR